MFSEHTVVQETQAVVIDPDVPLASASLIGCGVLTGVGAVFNRARPRHGQSAMVIGLGGIGLNVIQGLALSDALPIIAVDTNPAKEAAAREFGATHFIPAGPDVDTVEAVKEICPTGVDFAFECVGHAALIRTSIDCLDWGGSCVLLGVPKLGSEASFVVNDLYNDKSHPGLPVRQRPSPPRHPHARPPLQGRPPQARRAGHPDLRPRRRRSRRSPTCTTASSTAACSN